MNSERLTNVVVRTSGVLAALLAGWALAVRPMFAGAATPLHRNILVTLAVFMASLLAALAVALRRRFEFQAPAVSAALLVFLGATILTACFAGNRFAATVRCVEVASWTVLAIVLIDLASTPFRGRVLLATLVATLAVLAADGLYQHFVSLPAIQADLDTHVKRLVESGTLDRSMVDAFRKRATSGDVFVSFTTANEFAGYLILLLPVGAASVWVRWREQKSGRRLGPCLLLALVVAAGVFALVLTRSKGGWLSLAVGLGGWGAVTILGRLGRGPATVAAAALVACVVFLAPAAPSPDNETQAEPAAPHKFFLGDSAEVRIEYWKAGWEMFRQNPWIGVGPGNFADCYTAYRTPEGSETRRAHNDYIEVAVEEGAVGLAAFLAVWAAWGWAMGRKRRVFESDSEEGASSRRFFAGAVAVAGVAAVAFVLSRYIQTDETRGMLAVGAVLWVGVFLAQVPSIFRLRQGFGGQVVASEEPAPGNDRLLRGAIGAGVAALLVHFAIDFDLTEPGVTAALAGMLAAGLALRPAGSPAKERTFGPWVQLLVAVALAAPLVAGLVTVVYPLVDMSVAMEQATIARDLGTEKLAQARKRAESGDEHAAEELDREAKDLLGVQYPRFLDEAIGECPYAPEPWMDLAKMEAAAVEASPGAGSSAEAVAKAEREKLGRMVSKAKSLSPHDPAPWAIYAQTLASLSKSADNSGRADEGRTLASEALREIDGALSRYPAQPKLRLLRARLYDRLGRTPEAAAEYRSALDLAERTSQKELKFSVDDLRDIRLALHRIDSALPKR